MTLPPNHRFMIGDMYFETGRQINIKNQKLIGIYGKKESSEEFKEFDFLLDREVSVPAAIFGEKPEVNDALYLVSNDLPEAGSETIFYFNLQERFNRNPLKKNTENVFSKIKWECYTESGWEEMRVRDTTNSFLLSGEVRMWIPEGAALCHAKKVQFKQGINPPYRHGGTSWGRQGVRRWLRMAPSGAGRGLVPEEEARRWPIR